ncbi:M4 family metallopeptidase [Streptomyces spectabilis]|uniref:Neutral metalloproteinase n=1 Tax=Streptomyces spectabilis TaxID=68270 RepID=A0A7W8B7P2_STRST|nr:M4 family metallopeptidase [Streptomyces spectabilis]MBB5110078.1 Zn-dependent metalloprotease [Streptomyces spectabilis]
MHGNYRKGVTCAVLPPHMIEQLTRSEDPVIAKRARRTLERDVQHRTRRHITSRLESVSSEGVQPQAPGPQRTVYDARHYEVLPGEKVWNEGDAPTKDATINRACAGLGVTFDFYLKNYGRRSLDGRGLPLDAVIHYGQSYGNAFWDGERMIFGDGDGDLFLDFTIPMDIIGHELTHGIIQHAANLEYYGQSGALNESIADVFGALVKQYALRQTSGEADWLIGEGLLGPKVENGQALRSLKAPGTAYDDDTLGRDPQPTSMTDYVCTSRDNGGVHINSGIPNHAFYLLATTLGGYSWDRAGRIWYETLVGGMLPPDAQIADFARLSAASARKLYGDGREVQAVIQAWDGVDVTW